MVRQPEDGPDASPTTWALERYDDSLKLISALSFELPEEESVKRFLYADSSLLVISEYRDGDSIKMFGRRCDLLPATFSDPVLLLAEALQDDDEELDKGFIIVEPSENGRYLLLYTVAWLEVYDQLRYITVTCDIRLRRLLRQSLVVNYRESEKFDAIDVDNSGAVVVLRNDFYRSRRISLERYAPDAPPVLMPVNVADAPPDISLITCRYVMAGKDRPAYVYALLHSRNSKLLRFIRAYGCNWETGKSSLLHTMEMTSDVPAGPTPPTQCYIRHTAWDAQRVVLLVESLLDTGYTISSKLGTSYHHYYFPVQISYFSFDGNGKPLHQAGFACNSRWKNYPTDISSRLWLDRDTMYVQYGMVAHTRRSTGFRKIPLSGGTWSPEAQLIDYIGYADWTPLDGHFINASYLILANYEGELYRRRLMRVEIVR